MLFDDRPQLAVDHLAPSQQGVARNVDRGLGVIEISTLHARNLFREAVASDDMDQYLAVVHELARMMDELEYVAAAQRERLDHLAEKLQEQS
jgi:hypothetical protein